MFQIAVNVQIGAPIEMVFDAVADHERFFRAPDTEYCRLTTEGQSERNGLGAVREICTSGMVFTEEVTRFERPERIEYLVRRVATKSGRKLPLRHEIGWMQLTAGDEGTEVDWHSRFAIPIPVVGKLLEVVAGRKSAAGFRQLLTQVKSELEEVVARQRPG